MNKLANERILALVKEEYMKRIPFFIRKHATTKTCQLIEREFDEIYAVFSKEEEPAEDVKKQMSMIVNDIFEERMKKHNM